MTEITQSNENRLRQAESAIESAKQAVVAGFQIVGSELKTIQSGKLYKADGFSSFEAYCQTRWQFSRAQAYRLMSAVETISKMSPTGDIFFPVESEAVARELAKIKDGTERNEVWQAANEQALLNERAVAAKDVADIFSGDYPRIVYRNGNDSMAFEVHPIRQEIFSVESSSRRTDDIFDGLLESIKLVGFIESLIIYEGKILDGAARWRAIETLRSIGLKPKFGITEVFCNDKTAIKILLDVHLTLQPLTYLERIERLAAREKLQRGIER